LDEKPQGTQDIEESAQKKTIEILERADIVLLVLDNSQPAEELDIRLLDKIAGKQIITVLNKSDLPSKFDTSRLLATLSNTVQISAKKGTGIENLSDKIIKTVGTAYFDLQEPVCFTDRQEYLLKKLKDAEPKTQTASIITELLNGFTLSANY